MPPPATPPPPAPRPVIRPGQVLFNFQDADIQAVVKTVSQLTDRNFLIDPRVKGKVTIISAKPMSKAAAYQVFLSALKAQGFTAVRGPGGIIKVLPEADAKQGAPVNPSGPPRGGDQMTTQVVIIENGPAAQWVPMLRPLMAPNGLLSVYTPSNALIITDYADNIRRLLQIVHKVDQPGSADVHVIPLAHASALDMAQLLSRLADVVQPGQVGPPGLVGVGTPHQVVIVPDLRTNSLLVRTDNPGRLNQIETLISKLDVPARQGGQTHVVYLKNAQAKKIAEVLRGLLAGEARTAAPAGPVPAGAQAGGVQPSTVQADEASNALIINAPDAVYNNLRAVVEKLDIRRAQVFVEALIAEVTVDKAAEFGFQWATVNGAGQGAVAGLQTFPLTGNGLVGIAGNPVSIGAGLSLAYLGKKITLPDGRQVNSIGALARALEKSSDVNVLSTPNLLTLDNAEAKIVVGQNVPFLTGSFAQAAGATPGTVNPFQTIQRKDVGLTLKIKPQISEGNGINMKIFEEVSSIAPATTGAQDLITNKRQLETSVIVDDGATVVLGGLIDDNVQQSVQAVPLLSRIPLLGELFKYRQRTKKKTNLMIFLRPVIVRSVQDAEGFTAERYDYIRGQQMNMRMEPSAVLPRFGTPTLPPLTQPKPRPVKPKVDPAALSNEPLGPPDAPPAQ